MISKQSALVIPASMRTGKTLLLSVSTKRSCRRLSSAVNPKTIKSCVLWRSHSWRASFFKTVVHGACFGPHINFRLAQTSRAEWFNHCGLIALSTGKPTHRSTSIRKRRLSSSSSATGLFTTRIVCVAPYRSTVTLAATADAAPQENQTTIVGRATLNRTTPNSRGTNRAIPALLFASLCPAGAARRFCA